MMIHVDDLMGAEYSYLFKVKGEYMNRTSSRLAKLIGVKEDEPFKIAFKTGETSYCEYRVHDGVLEHRASCADEFDLSDNVHALCGLINGGHKAVPSKRKWSKDEIEIAAAFVRIFGDRSITRVTSEQGDYVEVILGTYVSIRQLSEWPNLNPGETVRLSDICSGKMNG